MKRKSVRVVMTILATGIVAMIGAGIYYTRPEVQKRLFLEAAAKAGWAGRVRVVEVSPGGAFRIEGVSLRNPRGPRLVVESATGRFAPWATLWGVPTLEQVEATGVEVEVRAEPGADASGGVAPGAAVESAWRWPAWRVERATVAGRLRPVPGAEWAGTLRVREADSARGGVLVADVTAPGGARLTGEARLAFAVRPADSARDFVSWWAAAQPELMMEAESRATGEGVVTASLWAKCDGATARVRVKAAGGSRLEVDAARAADGVTRFGAAWTLTPAALADAGWAGVLPGVFSGTVEADGSGGGWRMRKVDATVAGSAGVPVAGARLDGTVVVLDARGFPVADFSPRAGVIVSGGVLDGVFRAGGFDAGVPYVESSGPARLRVARLTAGPGTEPVVASLSGGFRAERVGGETRVVVRDAALDWAGVPAAGASEVRVLAREAPESVEGRGWVAPGVLPAAWWPAGVGEFCRSSGVVVRPEGRARFVSGEWVLERGSAEAVTAGGTRVARATMARPVVATGPATDGAPVATLELAGAPLAIFTPLCGGAKPEGLVESANLTIARTPAGWRVGSATPGEPVSIRRFGWTEADGRPVVSPADWRGVPEWESMSDGWRFSLTALSVGEPGAPAGRGRVALRWGDGIRELDVDLSGDAPATTRVFVGAGLAPLAAGRWSLTGRGGESGESDFQFRAEELCAQAGGAAASVSGRFSGRADATRRRFSFPVVLRGPSGVTPVELAGEAMREQSGWKWDARLSGGAIFADDWLALFSRGSAAPRAGGGSTGPVAESRGASPATVPVWDGHSGRVSVAFDAVRFAGERLESPRVVLGVERARLTADGFTARWRECPVSGDAALAFVSGKPTPYVLAGAASVSGVPLGTVIESLAPKAAGWLDGRFAATIAVAGEAATPGALAGSTVVRLTANGRDGTLRFFKADNEAIRTAGEVADIAGELAGDLGGLLGKRGRAPKVVETLDATRVLRRALDVVAYRACSLTVERTPDGALDVKDYALESDMVKLGGAARLGPPVGESFFARRANATLRVAAKGELAKAVTALGRASGPVGADGWLAGPVLQYDGPLHNLRSEFLTNLLRALSNRASTESIPSVESTRRTLETLLP